MARKKPEQSKTPEKPERSILREVIDEAPKDFIKRTFWGVFSALVVGACAIWFTGVSTKNIFGVNSDLVHVYARVDDRAKPGEKIELYPSPLEGVVSINGEVLWAGQGVPFHTISQKIVELRRVTQEGGRKTTSVLDRLPVDDAPVMAFLLEERHPESGRTPPIP